MSALFKATVLQILHHDDNTGRSILRVRHEEDLGDRNSAVDMDYFVIVGTIFSVGVGDELACHGDVGEHSRYGKQVRARALYPYALISRPRLESALESGIFKGIEPPQLKPLMEFINRVGVSVLDENPASVRSQFPLGDKQWARFLKDWKRYVFLRDEFSFLKNLGLADRLAGQVAQMYGGRTREVIASRPYTITSAPGIGFKKADEVAARIGVHSNSSARFDAALSHVFSVAMERGSTAISRSRLTEDLMRIMSPDDAMRAEIPVQVSRRVGSGLFQSFYKTDGDEVIVDLDNYHRERDVAANLHRLASHRAAVIQPTAMDPKYNEGQRNAVLTALRNKVVVITGGPGVGKSTIMKEVVAQMARSMGTDSAIALGAPTGKAARRLAAATGLSADTIHGIVGLKPGDSDSNPRAMLDCQALFLDELGCADLGVVAKTLSMLPDHARLIMIGDADQLPAVGAGNVLSDIIQSRQIPVARLTELCRTSGDSRIAEVAHQINSGEMPDLDHNGGGFTWIDADTDEQILWSVKHAITHILPNECGIACEQTQILSPQINTAVGIRNLNRALAPLMNNQHATGMPVILFGNEFRIGDRVMQVDANVKQLDLLNGDVGRILYFDFKAKTATIEFDSGRKVLPFARFINLRPAWASTVHKFQGSEMPAIIMPVSNSHSSMLFRQLFYTGATRAKEQLIMVGQRSALEKAIMNCRKLDRTTLLADQILRAFAPPARRRHMGI